MMPANIDPYVLCQSQVVHALANTLDRNDQRPRTNETCSGPATDQTASLQYGSDMISWMKKTLV